MNEPHELSSSTSDFSKLLIWFILIFLVVMLCYLPAVNGTFVLDDTAYITQNPAILNSSSPLHFWISPHYSDAWPLFYTMLWFFWRVFGEHSWAYHLVNIFVHSANACLFGLILSRYSFFKNRNVLLPMFLFALHPLNVESVAWIFQFKTLFSAFFALLSFYQYLKFDQEGGRKHFAFSVVLYALALLTKTTVIFFPVVMVLHHFVTRNISFVRALKRACSFFALSAIFGVFGMKVNAIIYRNIEVWHATPLERILTAANNYWFYLFKFFAPVGLVFIYPWNTPEVSAPSSYIPLLGILLLAFTGFYLYKNMKNELGRLSVLALAAYSVNLLPAMTFPFMRHFLAADHYQYFAMLSLIALIGGTILYFSEQEIFGAVFKQAWVIVAFFFLLSSYRSRIYKDSYALWGATIKENSTSAYVTYNFASAALDAKRLEEAEINFRRVLTMNGGKFNYLFEPERQHALFGLSKIYFEKGNFKQTEIFLKDLVSRKPTYPYALMNLGAVYQKLGRDRDAIETYYRIIQFDAENQNAIAAIRAIYSKYPNAKIP